MSVSEIHITTGEAAEIMRVHESTVKRWCDAGRVDFMLTSGGHRRIVLQSLLDYAAEEGLECELLAFDAQSEAAYEAMLRIVREDDFGAACDVVTGWLRLGDVDRTTLYFCYLFHNSVSSAAICDRIVQPVMGGVGHEWETGEIGVGEEHRLSHAMIDALYGFRTVLRRERASNGRTAIVACMEGNQHEIAAILVRIVLEAGGWKIVYLGADVPVYEIALQQQVFDASLVCISSAKPQVAADAIRSIRVLSTTYEPSHPYRLAIGGSPIEGLSEDETRDVPFLDYRTFTNMNDFASWIANGAHLDGPLDET